MPHDDLVGQATRVLKSATFRLAWEYPLHGRLLALLRTRPVDGTRSVTLGVEEMNVCVQYNPEYVARLDVDQCIGLLVHVLNHVIFGHLGMTHDEYPDRVALTIAQEVTANEWVDERLLPPDSIVLAAYPQLPPDEDTITRYERLCREQSAEPGGASPSGNDSMPEAQDDQASRSGNAPTPDTQNDHEVRADDGQTAPARNGQDGRRPDGKSNGTADAASRTQDDHAGWHAADESNEAAAALSRGIVLEAAENLTSDDLRRVAPSLLTLLHVSRPGMSPGNEQESVEDGGRGSLSWQRLLRRYASSALESEYSSHWPSRRAPKLVGIIPGRRRSPGRKSVMAVIDTSGSVSVCDLTAIAKELRGLARYCAVNVVQCDVAIHDIAPFNGRLDHVVGRGGTDLRPPFEPALLRKLRPDVVVYFTDGCGPAPAAPPKVPVLWCITWNGVRPAQWGQMARMAEGLCGVRGR